MSLKRLCWRHLTTAVTHNGFAFGVCVSANCFHPALLFVYLIQEGQVLPRELPNNLLNSSMAGQWAPPNQLFPQSNVLVTGSSILLVPQAKNLGSPPRPAPHVPRLWEKSCWLHLQPGIQSSRNQRLPPGSSHHRLSLKFRKLPPTVLPAPALVPNPGGQMHYFETRVRSRWSFAQSPPALHHTSVKVNPHCSPQALQDLPPTLLWPHALHHWAPATLPSTPLHLPHACHRAFALPRCFSPECTRLSPSLLSSLCTNVTLKKTSLTTTSKS